MLQGLLCTRAHPFIVLIPQQTFCEGQACFFHPNTYPQTLLTIQEGGVFNQKLKWNLPRGARGVCLWGIAPSPLEDNILVWVGAQP